MERIYATLGDRTITTHLYEVYVRVQGESGQKIVEVYANTRSQANKIASNEGYEVCSVNMVG